MEKLKNHKMIFILILILVILMILVSNKGKLENVEAADIEFEKTNEVQESVYKVDIKGAVMNPGVYEVDKNDRVIDVINKAGGLLDNSNTLNINLSKRIYDEMVIIINTKEEVEQGIENPSFFKEDINNLISINTASVDELTSLDGIGKSKALAIMKYRETQKFNSIEDIKNVTGIGDSLFEKIKDYITV